MSVSSRSHWHGGCDCTILPAVNYDVVAPEYDRRYERLRFDGVEAVLGRFIGGSDAVDVAEVACGTGHWLAWFGDRVRSVTGLDPAPGMLQRARSAAPRARLVRGRAEQLPWAEQSFDRLCCINALHHFDDVDAFLGEACRVLRPGGAILTVGLDPHTGLDAWWIYDYFPGALESDRARYLATSDIRTRLDALGFAGTTTDVAQHIRTALPVAEAAAQGLLDRRSTSQLMVMSDAEYDEGMRRLQAEQPTLEADLRLYATVAWKTPADPFTGNGSPPSR
jgi:SAM-dependent methyltransferase